MMQHMDSWSPLDLTPVMQERTLALVHEIVYRLIDSRRIDEAVKNTTRQSVYPPLFFSAYGFSGVSLPLAHYLRCFPEQEKVKEVLFRMLCDNAQMMRTRPFYTPGLFSGTAGMAHVYSYLAQDEARYRPVAQKTVGQLAHQVLARSWRAENGVIFSDYDVIEGASGIVRVLISAANPTAEVEQAILTLLSFLVWLSDTDTSGCPNSYISPSRYPKGFEQYYQLDFPSGYVNLGLAHGIPGPLAALALSWRAGRRVEGHEEAICRLSSLLVEHSFEDQWGINWSNGLPVEDGKVMRRHVPTRVAWCYGVPGIAWALWVAGKALHHQEWCVIATQAMQAAFRRPDALQSIVDDGLCHGVAGLLLVCLHFLEEGALIDKHFVRQLLEVLLAHYDSSRVLGYYAQEHERKVDTPAWLTGAPGVFLALLAVSTSTFPAWDQVLLLS